MNLERLLKAGKSLGIVALVVIAYWAGTRSGKGPGDAADRTGPESLPAPATMADHDLMNHAETVWTCVMHRQILRSEPGQCPICSMELVPIEDEQESGSSTDRLVMSEDAKRLAEIVTTEVTRKFVTAQIRMVGKVDYDETRVKSISAWVPGRIDRLYVDYTGVEVKKGEHLVMLYSPEFLTAQEELLQAKQWAEREGSEGSEILRRSDKRRLKSAREKLRLWGLSADQIHDIEERGEAQDHMEINSPTGGVVVHKGVQEGEYVKTGTHLYTIADLSRVWVKLDAYESDLAWLHYGQNVEIEIEASPGQIFHGRISFIDPLVDPSTRTVKVRVNVDNSSGSLKPEMFVRAVVYSNVAQGGKVMDPNLAGKWIGPMHPEILSDEPGQCPICNMDLVKAEDLGYVSAEDETAKPLVVPATAVLRTGRRAVVYIQVPNQDRPTFEGREVTLGQRAGDYYIIREGLAEGERVVVHGNFKIDSALQIQAKPSMMSMPAEIAGPVHRGGADFRGALAMIYSAYLEAQNSLGKDNLASAAEALASLAEHVGHVDSNLISGTLLVTWTTLGGDLADRARAASESGTIESIRREFDTISEILLKLEEIFGHGGETTFIEAFCPMAFDGRGARWLQTSGELLNPYYGSAMPTCGVVKTELEAHPEPKATGPAGAHQHQH